MAQERTQRRLAAILAADVVGYSRLMERDEAGTLVALKLRRRNILDPLLAQHGGRVVKTMGDGVLVEFASAVEAVQCAIDLQQRMSEANSVSPDDAPIVLRVGVNLGDVVVEGGDIYGDGVIVAARLEAMAEPGSIYLAGSIYDQVKGKLKTTFEDFGRQVVKNIAEPVQVYRIRPALPMGLGHYRANPEVLPLPAKPSIAVLPFQNMSGDPDQDYFADGRRDHHRPVTPALVVRDRAQFKLHLQGSRRRGEADRTRAGGALRARRQCAQGGKQSAHHGTAHRCLDRSTSVG